MIRPQIRAGQGPPSTGPPLYSYDIDFVLSAWPTHTHAVKWSVPPQNQASPLFSVVPVLPQALGAAWASRPVPSRTFSRRMFLIVSATPEERTRVFFGLSSARVSPFGSVILS